MTRETSSPSPGEIHEILFANFTSYDALSLALARTKSNKISADIDEWNALIFTMKQKFEKNAPKVLEDIHFQNTTEENPTSDELETFFSIMTRSEGADALLHRTMYQGKLVFEMPQEAKDFLSHAHSHPLQSYSVEINQLARAIEDNLGIPQED